MSYKDCNDICITKDHPYFNKIAEMLDQYDNRHKKEVVSFIGRAGSGKDYQCQLLQDNGYVKVAFADALRDIAFECIDLDEQEGMIFYDYLKSHDCIELRLPDDYRRFNFRQFLERLGTQGIRKYDNDFWCSCLLQTLENKNANKYCISDMRFPNEYNITKNWCLENGYEFKCIFCDYHSDRYQENNSHESARMGNYFATHGYSDLQEISDSDMKDYFIYLDGVGKYITCGKL